MEGNIWNIVGWAAIALSVLYWVVMVVRKKTRPQATEALGKIAQTTSGSIIKMLLWTIAIIIVTILMAFVLIGALT